MRKGARLSSTAVCSCSSTCELHHVLGRGEWFLTTIALCRYCPALTNEDRLPFKNDFNAMVDRRVRNLIKAGREVIVVGDLVRSLFDQCGILCGNPADLTFPSLKNICASDLDTVEPTKRAMDQGLANFTDFPPRAWLRDFVGSGGPMIDITRKLHPNRLGMFTCAYADLRWLDEGGLTDALVALGWDTKTEARSVFGLFGSSARVG